MPNKPNRKIGTSRAFRWQAVIALIAICVLYFILPERLTVGPNWLVPLIALLLLIPTTVFHQLGRRSLNVFFGIAMLSAVTLALMLSLGFLIAGLPDKRMPPEQLLRSAVALWISNVLVFASWYWRLDAGGPHNREASERHSHGAFLFPQMTLPETSKVGDPTWKPEFVDYLFLAFTASTAFSPTDVPVLSRWAKVLMMMQSCISLATVAILAARAINIL
jgi:hypothetical protein